MGPDGCESVGDHTEINGGKVSVIAQDGNYSANTDYRILSANGGVLGGLEIPVREHLLAGAAFRSRL